MIAVLAIVLNGKRVAALQEAGLLDIRPMAAVPRIDVLGIFPTWAGVAAQLLTRVVVVGGVTVARCDRRGAAPACPVLDLLEDASEGRGRGPVPHG